MANNYWEKIYENVSTESEKAKEKSKKGKLLSSHEAATIREKRLYDQIEERKGKDTLEERWENLDAKEKTPVKAAALHTIHKVEKYADLNAASHQEAEEKFLKLTRERWDEIAVHERPDSDANACLKLMELAGINVSKANQIQAGTKAESGVTMDTSEKQHGVLAEEGGKRLVIDHHGKESKRDSSATKFVYETLIDLGLLEKNKRLDRFVEFITEADNFNFTLLDKIKDEKTQEEKLEKVYQNYHLNLYGLSAKMKIEDILELFQKDENFDPSVSLSQEYLENTQYYNPQGEGKYEPLIKWSKHLEEQMKIGRKAFINLEKAGYVIDTGKDRFGKIMIDTKKKTKKNGYYNRIDGEGNSSQLEVFRRSEYGGYLVWSPEEKCFVLFTKKEMNEETLPGGFSQGFNMRGGMWMLPKNNGEQMTITLEEIFSKLTGKKFQFEYKQKTLFEKDKKAKEMLALLDDKKLTEADLREGARQVHVPLSIFLEEIYYQRQKLFKLKEKAKKAISEEQKGTVDYNALYIKVLLDYQAGKIKNGEDNENTEDNSKE